MQPAQKSMLKRIFLFAIITISLMTTTWVLAQESNTATKSGQKPTPSAGNLVNEEKVKQLKEKLATKVAELRENQTRGWNGEIAALSKTSFTLVTSSGEIKVRFDDDTLVYKLGSKKTEASSKDLKNAQTVSVLGLYESEVKQQTAKVILLQTLPKFYTGKVTQVDKTQGTLTITTDKNVQIILDYEKTTTATEYDLGEKKLKKSGLSRIATNDTIQAWGYLNEDDVQKVRAVKIIRLPKELTTSETEVKGTTTASAVPVESSPSATPKAKASPKATPKASPKSSPAASTQP